MKQSDRTKARRALRTVLEAAGAISTVAALASQGVPGARAGQWIEAGLRLLEDGWLPDHWRCGTAACGYLLPMIDPATRKAWIRIPACPACRANDWAELSEADALCLKLARSDDRTDELLTRKAGSRLRKILGEDDPKYATAQAKLIPWYLAIANPAKFGPKTEAETPALDGNAPAWTRALKPEDIDRLPASVLDRLQEIADEHAALDAEARQIITDALGGVITVEAPGERP